MPFKKGFCALIPVVKISVFPLFLTEPCNMKSVPIMHVSPSCYIVLTIFQIFWKLMMMFATSKHVLKLKNVITFLKITVMSLTL